MYAKDTDVGRARPFGFAQVKRYLTNEDATRSFFLDLQHAMSTLRGEHSHEDVYLTEVIRDKDPRSSSKEMPEAKRREIRGLLERGTFKVILREDIPEDGNVLPGRFVPSIKSTEDREVKWKARYVIGVTATS